MTAQEAPLTLPKPGFWKAVQAVFLKDLLAEWRSREILTAQISFALIVLIIFNFALEFNPKARYSVAVGVLWTLFAFAGTLGLNRSWSMERENQSMEGLLLAPVDRSALYLGKALANLVFMAVTAALVLPVYAALYNIALFRPGFLGVLVLGFVGYAGLGTLVAAMSVQARTRDILLPLLLFPLLFPVLVMAVRASEGLLTGASWEEVAPWLRFLLAYDVIFVTLAFLGFGYVVEE